MKSLALFDKVLTFSHLWMVTVHVGGDAGRLVWDVDLLFQTLKRRLPLLLTLLKYLFNFHQIFLIGQVDVRTLWRGIVTIHQRTLVVIFIDHFAIFVATINVLVVLCAME